MFSAATKTDGASTAVNYVEDVFSTTLYTGNSGNQTIVNGVALGDDYGGSVYFDSNADYLSNTSAALITASVSTFTAEGWIYMTANPTSDANNISGFVTLDGQAAGNLNYLSFGPISSRVLYLRWFDGVGKTAVGSTTLNLNQWYHIACVVNSNSIQFYVNGVAETMSGTTTLTNRSGTTGNFAVGANNYGAIAGYISNLRVTNTAVYTSAFTPSTTPLTAISGTQLLTCQSPSPTTDYSSNAYSITVTNAVAQNGGGPFIDSSANKGGLVWIKSRSGATDHALYDTSRGATFDIASNLTTGQTTQTTGLIAFNSNGFSIGSLAKLNNAGVFYASWTFREQSKFFDVVTYTGTGVNRTIAHNLGSVPGCMIIKRTDTTAAWAVYHRSLANTQYLVLNTTAGAATSATYWNSTTPTSTEFTVGTNASVNANGGTYVAYLFAHDAGGFGLTGSDNVISCGSFIYSPGTTVNLGYEPQWILFKETSTSDWFIADTTRGWTTDSASSWVAANTNATEVAFASLGIAPTSTGFRVPTGFGGGATYIYIAIRRDPMKTPTTGTSVFQPVVYTGTNVDNRLVNTSLFTDFILARQRNSTTLAGMLVGDRLRGNQYWLTDSTGSGVTDADSLMTPTLGYGYSFSAMNGFGCGNDATSQLNASTVASNQVVEAFARAPGFLDVVAYTGTGVARTINHNLGVKPEMMWIKRLTVSDSPIAYVAPSVAQATLSINGTGEFLSNPNAFNNTEPTSTQFTVGTGTGVNASGSAYVAYLMASVPGVSKCSYYVGRGVGTSQQVDCGFASGARFILIKSLGVLASWFVYDTARGIIAGNDPYVLLDSTAAEVTSTDYIDPYSPGFEITTTAPATLNEGYAGDWVGQAAVAGTTNMLDALYAGGLWVVGSSNGNVYYGASGYSWTAAAAVSGGVDGLAFGNNLYVAVGPGGRISTSPDATTWTTRTSGVVLGFNGAAYGFGKYWACGDTGTLVSSSDGVTWSTVSLGTTADLYRVRFLNGQLVIVGQTGTLITSSDGTSFTTRTTGVTTQLRDVTFAASTYVAVGLGGTIITSTNLSTWTTRSAGSLAANNIYGVTYAGYRFIAVATAGETAYSSDGTTWTTGAGAGGTPPLYCVAYGNDIVVAGNGDGDLYLSDMRYWYWAIA